MYCNFSRRRFSALASRTTFAGLLLLLAAAVEVQGQSTSPLSIRNAFDNGNFSDVVRSAPHAIGKARKTGSFRVASEIGVFQAHALMRLERYEEAGRSLDEALTDASQANHARSIASVHLAKASLFRLLRDFPSAIKFARIALAAAPADPRINLEYHLAIGRILYSSGYDIAAIIWLERAERMSASLPMSAAHLEVLGHLSFAWTSKFDYAKAIEYGRRLITASEKTRFKYRHRLALYNFAGLLDSIGQRRKAKTLYETGLKLALTAKDDYQSCLFLSTQMLTSLYKGDSETAEKQLLMLDRADRDGRFHFESVLGKAVIAGLKGQRDLSDDHFKELASLKNHSEYMVSRWRAILAESKKDWAGSIEHNEVLRKTSEDRNFRDDLLEAYFSLAKGYWGLGKHELAREYAKRSAAIIEGDRPVGDAPLSLAMLETYHSVYRLLSEIEESRNDIAAALELADYTKARVLRDRIENSALRRRSYLDPEVRNRADELSKKLVAGSDVWKELADFERSVTLSSPRGDLEVQTAPVVTNTINLPPSTAIVSYLFTLDGELRAYVVEHGKPVRSVKLSLSEKDADNLAETVSKTIRDKVFFKTNGRNIYDKLLAPLAVTADHVAIVPDRSLWKIPFHALSPDGQSYLIEHKLVSYAPSVASLMQVLKQPPPSRKVLGVFANDSYKEKYLGYVNDEAARVSSIFGIRPVLNARRSDFLNNAQTPDMLHFSMHAEIDSEDPLRSFLAFRQTREEDGRLAVEDLLGVRLKPGSLVFLASCDTSSVLNGEGLVSIAWAMLGSGSTSVISAQWEANDRSTARFAGHFYREYQKGGAAAKAMQSASIAMIRDKTSGTHEPYFWAALSLMGDYR